MHIYAAKTSAQLLRNNLPTTMKEYILGVDTSNYTTSLALICHGKVIKNVRRLLPVESGKKGLRQSDAVFLHTKSLPELSRELFCDFDVTASKLCAVGVSVSPRDADGSYMPCFLSGISYASAISDSLKIPLYRFSHQCGHIRSAIYSCGKPYDVFEHSPFISFHVSGGTTEALITNKSQNGYSCEIAGGSNDASCGQIIDRAGVMMGLDFPCGKELDALSLGSTKKLTKCVSIKDTYFSMSGLENKVQKFISDGEEFSDIARFIFESIASSLEKCTMALREKHGNLPVIYAGGVMGNSIIRQKLSEMNDVYFASSELSSDNACGTALLAYDTFIRER